MPSSFALPFRVSYNVITPGLAMGGAIVDSSLAFEEFDVLVLCAGEWQPHIDFPENAPSKSILRIPYDDSSVALTPSVCSSLHASAASLASLHRHGTKILITCLAGRNRSGLLVALVLMKRFGYTAQKAIALVKEQRGDFALTNATFTSYLMSLR